MNTSLNIKIEKSNYKILKSYPNYPVKTLVNYAIIKARESIIDKGMFVVYPIQDRMSYSISMSVRVQEVAKIYSWKLGISMSAFISFAINTMITEGNMPKINEVLLTEKFIIDNSKYVAHERN